MWLDSVIIHAYGPLFMSIGIAGIDTGLDINYLTVHTFGANCTASEHLPIQDKSLYSVS